MPVMGIVLALRPPGHEACARWTAAELTSPPEGLPTGIYDIRQLNVLLHSDLRSSMHGRESTVQTRRSTGCLE